MDILYFIVPFFLMGIAWLVIGKNLMMENSGWKDLEYLYKTRENSKSIRAVKLNINSINLGGLGASNVFNLYESEKGLYIFQGFFLRFSKHNLFIPWEAFQQHRERKLMFGKSIRLIIGDPFVSFIDLSENDFKKIAHRIPHSKFLKLS